MNKQITDAITSIKEMLDSIRSIKGDKFTKYVEALYKNGLAVSMIGKALDEGEISERMVAICRHVSCEAMACTFDLLAEAYELSSNDRDEALEWANTLMEKSILAVD